MIVSKETTLSNLVIAVRNLIGDRLAFLPNSNLRAVKKSYQGESVQPPYPFIDIEYESSADNTGNSIRHKYIDEDNLLHIVSEQPYTFLIKCFGENATEILTEFKYILNNDDDLIAFNETVGGVLTNIEEPVFQPTFKETGFIKSAYVNATFMILHDYTTTTSTVESVEVEGEVERVTQSGEYPDYEYDPDPLSVTFTTDINT